MAIDKSGKWWVGSDPGDLDEYLRDLTTDGYPADRFVHARCSCGSNHFGLKVDADEGCAQRVCVRCQSKHLICDSGEAWSDARPKAVKCPCRGKVFEVAVAFSHREDGSVKWITVGERCTTCGVLGSAVDWKIDYAPSEHLYAQV